MKKLKYFAMGIAAISFVACSSPSTDSETETETPAQEEQMEESGSEHPSSDADHSSEHPSTGAEGAEKTLEAGEMEDAKVEQGSDAGATMTKGTAEQPKADMDATVEKTETTTKSKK